MDIDRNEKLEKARKKLQRYQRKKINSELHSNISEDDIRRFTIIIKKYCCIYIYIYMDS